MELVCFSGGECFILGKDLDRAVAHASSLGLATRCVTNGYWAYDHQRAGQRLDTLAAAGLRELNLSTGDEHQQFVPYDRIVNAGIEAACRKILTVIVVEGSEQAKFRKIDMLEHEEIRAFLRAGECTQYLRFMENIWMTFHADSQITHPESVYKHTTGCPNILNNFVATPSGQMASCCGLTMEYIPEMKVGDGDGEDFAAMYELQLKDFLKIWLSVDGPKKILDFAIQKNPQIQIHEGRAHSCEACALVYQRPDVRETLQQHFQEKVGDVLTRFYLVQAVKRGSRASSQSEMHLAPEMFGA